MKNRILQIDDDPAMLKIVASVLSRDPSLETKGVLSGDEGVAAAADWLPDLILSDVSMPGMDGFAVLARLRDTEITAHIPVVFTTARGGTDNLVEYLSRGAVGVIVKPFRLGDLASRVREYLDVAEAEMLDPSPPPDVGIDGRLRADAASLTAMRAEVAAGSASPVLRNVVHKLAGVAGIYGLSAISEAAAQLDKDITRVTREGESASQLLPLLDALLDLLRQETDVARTER
ncbi:response regulator [Rhodopseudomonas palustris]|uniref:Response regulator n=1 Tax=Rhodopseudomonas palustris TaxID=1076 RepID=A0A323UZY7_RHOPL|nr:response regulator [Rhodopseudomonas palustris]PZA13478.1 response regulator [Rhodopseudomonas palustris]